MVLDQVGYEYVAPETGRETNGVASPSEGCGGAHGLNTETSTGPCRFRKTIVERPENETPEVSLRGGGIEGHPRIH